MTYFQRDLSGFAVAGGLIIGDESDVRSVIKSAQNALLSFATSEWLQLAPDLVKGVEGILRGLAPEVTLGDAFPHVWSDKPRPKSSVPIPTASPPSVASPALPPPLSIAPSSGSRDVGLSSRDSDVTRPARPTRPLPRVTFRRQQALSVKDAPPPPPVASSLRLKKQSGAAAPLAGRPNRKFACVRCRKKKKGCMPPEGAEPPFSSCVSCLREGVECIRGPIATGAPFLTSWPVPCSLNICRFSDSSRKRRRLSPPPPPAPVKAATPDSPPEPLILPPDELPAVPLYGTGSAPLSVLLASHTEVSAATRDHTAAALALDVADRRRRTALSSYLLLLGMRFVDDHIGKTGNPS